MLKCMASLARIDHGHWAGRASTAQHSTAGQGRPFASVAHMECCFVSGMVAYPSYLHAHAHAHALVIAIAIAIAHSP